MFDKCASCGSIKDFVFYRITAKNEPLVYCRDCHKGVGKGKPDVWYGYGSGTHTEENIADPKTGQPIPFSSPQQKVEAMRIAGVHEAGDRVGGRRNEDTLRRKTYI